MLEVSDIRHQKDRVKEGLKKRNWSEDQLAILDEIVNLDDRRKEIQTASDALLADRNALSKQIGTLFKEGKGAEADELKRRVGDLKEQIEKLGAEAEEVKSGLHNALLDVPNVPHHSVPAGKGEADNEVYQAWDGEMPELQENALAHWDLAEQYDLINFRLGTVITGSGFVLYRGRGAKLERALINFFLDRATGAGYEEILPPLLVNADTAMATGQLPDKEGQMYHVEKDGLYLIPTAEVPITNVYRDAILDEDDLPIKMTGYTPCFRREAGSYGSDVKGLNRVHQFDKVEVVQLCHPEKSYDALMEMVGHVDSVLQDLKLPYRILRLCGGDLGFTAALTFDFEVYAAAQKKWLEVSSVSNFEAYQSNRLRLRFRDREGNNRLAHTLNGSALALARIVAALLENNQSGRGIEIPEVLWPYTGFEYIS